MSLRSTPSVASQSNHRTWPMSAKLMNRNRPATRAERLHSPPLPFLFQRRWELINIGITHMPIKSLLDELVEAARHLWACLRDRLPT